MSWQSRSHSAHVGQDIIIHYRWHPLSGRNVRLIQVEQGASTELVHVELTRLSQLKQKSLEYQGGTLKSLHYRAGAAA
jgi:hypothetical protein